MHTPAHRHIPFARNPHGTGHSLRTLALRFSVAVVRPLVMIRHEARSSEQGMLGRITSMRRRTRPKGSKLLSRIFPKRFTAWLATLLGKKKSHVGVGTAWRHVDVVTARGCVGTQVQIEHKDPSETAYCSQVAVARDRAGSRCQR